MKKFILAFTAILSIGMAAAFANYTMTQGAGTTFGSVIVGGFHYVQMFVCDLTTPAQCQSVSAAGAAKVDGSAVTQPVSSTTLSTKANQDTNTATTAHTCSVAGFSELGCLGQVNDSINSATPAGTNIIGKVGIDQTTPGTTNLVALGANQSVNVAQFGGTSTSTGQVAVSVAPVTATNTALVTALRPDSPGIITLGPAAVSSSVPFTLSSQYPTNATTTTPTAITASTTGTTGATTATLAGVASKTTFICGFTISSDATAALAGAATVTGTITGTLNYIQNVGSATAAGVLTQTFSPCIPASATNTGIAVRSEERR